MPRIIAVALGCVLALATSVGLGLHHHAVRTAVPSLAATTLAVTPSAASIAERDTPPTTRSYVRPPIRRTVHPGTVPTPHATAHPFARSASAGTVPAVWRALAHCESTDDWHINTGNGFYGGLQITMENARDYGFARPDLLAPAEQIRLARLILRDQGPNAWPVCGPRVGLARGA